MKANIPTGLCLTNSGSSLSANMKKGVKKSSTFKAGISNRLWTCQVTTLTSIRISDWKSPLRTNSSSLVASLLKRKSIPSTSPGRVRSIQATSLSSKRRGRTRIGLSQLDLSNLRQREASGYSTMNSIQLMTRKLAIISISTSPKTSSPF